MLDERRERPERLRVELLKMGELTVRSERSGVVHTIELEGELDLATAGVLERELKSVEASDAQSIVLDLSELRFIDSTGVRVVLSAHRRSRANSDRLALLRGPRAVQRVLEITGIEDVLPFVD